jgi:nitrite reductase/ring-hydroxylating ferredoxin subunit/alkylhydroperoxidase/carboxymuconolactone decarboxylase family protein YurZ
MSEDASANHPDEELSGLQWLSKERPEAMQHLLAFFRESGQHLDPKTRFLISVVTKVVRLSERGLRQYIPRAMREGASRDEILDAILCAYPAAGLTNVVDAVQVLRALEQEGLLPGERATEAPATPGERPMWTEVARAEELPPGSATVVTARGRSVALYHVGTGWHATANACLHQGGELGCGALDGSIVTCHRHGWQFDVTTGACLTRPGENVESYPVRVDENGKVSVLI